MASPSRVEKLEAGVDGSMVRPISCHKGRSRLKSNWRQRGKVSVDSALNRDLIQIRVIIPGNYNVYHIASWCVVTIFKSRILKRFKATIVAPSTIIYVYTPAASLKMKILGGLEIKFNGLDFIPVSEDLQGTLYIRKFIY